MTTRDAPSEDWDDGAYGPEDDADDDSTEELPCPACGELVYEETEKCPHCGDWINPRRPAARHRPWVWVTALIMLVIFTWLVIQGW